MTRRWQPKRRRSRSLVPAVAVGIVVLVTSACTATATPSGSVSVAPSAPTSPSASPAITSEIVGYWHRPQTCEEMLAAFQAAGLAESHVGWAQGNFFGGERGPTGDDPCAGAQGPLEHSHWFTADGEFGSHDEDGEEVDFGDYALVDSDTLSFPSHASEFGYDGDLVVDFAIDNDVVAFDVLLPESCNRSCQNAYAWALSAFASGPWARGDVP